MNLRSAGTSTCLVYFLFRWSWLPLSFSGKTSAMATSLIGPFLTDRAFSPAPVPRPPQPIRATWMVLLSAACTCGTASPARAEATAAWLDFAINSRRDMLLLTVDLLAVRWEGESGYVVEFPGFSENVNQRPADFMPPQCAEVGIACALVRSDSLVSDTENRAQVTTI